ncbi:MULTISPECIES: lasso RiPP family leader peptide-containing protein [Protofrankia]|nr:MULTISPECIES: lasso RiPP family leader peptide-containing protein [Protofrankia]
MKAPYQPPALQEVGTFPVVTEGYYGGHRRDYYGGYHKFRRFRRFRGFRHGY